MKPPFLRQQEIDYVLHIVEIPALSNACAGTDRQLGRGILEPVLRRWTEENGCSCGSFVRDLFIEHVAKSRCFTDTRDERYLRELVEEGEIEVLNRALTTANAGGQISPLPPNHGCPVSVIASWLFYVEALAVHSFDDAARTERIL